MVVKEVEEVVRRIVVLVEPEVMVVHREGEEEVVVQELLPAGLEVREPVVNLTSGSSEIWLELPFTIVPHLLLVM